MRGNAHLEYNPDFNYKRDEVERCNIGESAQGEKSTTRATGMAHASEDHRRIAATVTWLMEQEVQTRPRTYRD